MGYKDLFDLNEVTWAEKALCIDMPTKVFFPVHTHEDGSYSGPDSYKKAREVCRGCEVQGDCLFYAIEHHIDFGMWGGMSPRERRLFKRKLRRGAA